MIEQYQVKRARGMRGYRFQLLTEQGKYRAVSDERLGSLVAAQRELVRLLAADHGITITPTGDAPGSPVVIERCTIEPARTQAGFAVELESGRYRFTAYMDPTLESLLTLWGGAMKFFALKTGLIIVDSEGAWNAEGAYERGHA